MKVESLIKNLDKVKAILELYRQSSVEAMLDDIQAKLTEGPKVETQPQPLRPPGAEGQKTSPQAEKKGSRKKTAENFEPEKLACLLPTMPKEAIEPFLKQYSREQVHMIAEAASVKVRKSYGKGITIALIANHYGYIQLDQDIAQRPEKQAPGSPSTDLIEE